MMLLLIKFFIKFKNNEKEKHKLKNEAHTDFLTGLVNRRGLEQQIKQMQANLAPMYGSVAIFDIDYFKNINDKHGHDIGDEILVWFSKICLNHLTNKHILSRLGGDEFILLMPETDLIKAKRLCEELRKSASKGKHQSKGISIGITMSIGLVAYTEIQNIKKAISCADEALYKAKEQGRNCVCIL